MKIDLPNQFESIFEGHLFEDLEHDEIFGDVGDFICRKLLFADSIGEVKEIFVAKRTLVTREVVLLEYDAVKIIANRKLILQASFSDSIHDPITVYGSSNESSPIFEPRRDIAQEAPQSLLGLEHVVDGELDRDCVEHDLFWNSHAALFLAQYVIHGA